MKRKKIMDNLEKAKEEATEEVENIIQEQLLLLNNQVISLIQM